MNYLPTIVFEGSLFFFRGVTWMELYKESSTMNSCFIKNLITSNYRGRLTGILIIRIAWAQLNLARGWCMLFTNLWVYNPGYQPPFNYTSYPWDNEFFQGMMSGWILCNFSESSGAQGESMTLKHFLHFDCKKNSLKKNEENDTPKPNTQKI